MAEIADITIIVIAIAGFTRWMVILYITSRIYKKTKKKK
jgi:hypothetical protein